VNRKGRMQIRKYLQENLKRRMKNKITKKLVDKYAADVEANMHKGVGACFRVKPNESRFGYTTDCHLDESICFNFVITDGTL
jgi:hypothetical protein